jgi:epoxyqueuosine reductase
LSVVIKERKVANTGQHPFSREELAGQLIAELRSAALGLGFARLGIAQVARPPHHDAFRAWLMSGLAGPMHAWLARHEPLRGDPASLLEGAKSVIMLATDHARGTGNLTPPEPGVGCVARYAWGDDYHDLLRSRANELGRWLERRVPGCSTRGVVDSAPLAERDFAWLAGLGWFGKNTMLIDPRAGSYFFLTAILTDVDLPADTPLMTDHCGTCTACLDACPTQAFPEPRVLDANRCISGLTIEERGAVPEDLRAGMGDWIFGCDICQEVCPWNRHAPGSDDPAFQPRQAEAALPLADLLALDDTDFRARFKGSPILRAKRHGLARSAAIVLGNRPHPPAFAALAAALDDAHPVVREAAAWALGRWIEAGVMPHEARAALTTRGYAVSSTSAAGSRPGPSAE